MENKPRGAFENCLIPPSHIDQVLPDPSFLLQASDPVAVDTTGRALLETCLQRPWIQADPRAITGDLIHILAKVVEQMLHS